MPTISHMSLAFLRCTLDNTSEVSRLRGNALVLSQICSYIDRWIMQHIKHDPDAYKLIPGHVPFFPKPQQLNINMFPFKLFDLMTLPSECYTHTDIINIIKMCRSHVMYDPDMNAYLTIHAMVQQSRIRIARPSIQCKHNRWVKRDINNIEYRCLAWGLGSWTDIPVGGIYMATTVPNSIKIWASTIEYPEDASLEFARDDLGEWHIMESDRLYWMTDRTPHEIIADCQIFQLVIGDISE